MPSASTQTLRLADGRLLAYAEYGDPGGHPLFYAHGGPGSRLEGSQYHQKARHYGYRLIATDRPGLGRSTFQPERTLLDYPRDLAELANALGIDRCGVIGHSGGGAFTVACAYALSDRLTHCIALAGYTNFAELPGAADMLTTRADRLSVDLSQRFPRLFRLFFDLLALNVRYFPEAYYRAVVAAGNETDRAICANPLFKTHLIADQQEALLQGGKGVAVDAAIHYRDWGFRLAEIPGRVNIVHGTEDNFVPLAYAQHLADNIPQARLHLLEHQGHLFPWTHQDFIFQLLQL